jgi:nucleotide-binding universal stress UspA family protein
MELKMKFLLAFNGTEEAKAALTLARTHAEIFHAKVYIITSMGGGRGEKPEEINKTSRDLQFAEQFLKEKGIACETFQLARGMSPGEDMVSFAEEHEIDQIFVGVEKKSRTQKILLGSTAQYIILKAPCPVMSVNRSIK